VVQQAGREHLLDGVPGEMEIAAALIDLMIEVDLWGLGYPVGYLSKLVDRLPPRHALGERAGEHDRHGRALVRISPFRNFLEQLQAAIFTMVEIASKLRGDPLCQDIERFRRVV